MFWLFARYFLYLLNCLLPVPIPPLNVPLPHLKSKRGLIVQ